MGSVCSTNGQVKGARRGFWWANLREGDHMEDPAIRWEDKIKMDLRDVGWEAWTGSICHRIGTVGELL